MKLRLCTMGNTVIRLHAATLLMAAYMLLIGRGSTLMAGMLSILLHEGAHGLVAAGFGAPPNAIEITPLGAVMHLEDEARLLPSKRCIMLAAGPLTTLALCACALMLAARRILPVGVCGTLFRVNIGFLLINLLPCLPLDGGRLLCAGLSAVMSGAWVQRIMRVIGVVTGLACVLLSAVITWQTGGLQFTLAACGCVMIYAAHTSTVAAAMEELRQWMARKIRMEQRGCMPVRRIAVMSHYPLRRVIAALPQYARAEITVLEAGTMRRLGCLQEEQIFQHYMTAPWSDCGAMTEATGNETADRAAHR
ncbi:MAG: hypothetical protein IKK21_06040 [Clostridia bacterium]|nr:hypothetical protein [Clostridia bacterium]